MKRRTFVINVSLTSIALAAEGTKGLGNVTTDQHSIRLIETLALKGFEDEVEEYPKLVTNGGGDSWMFTLRRLPYPQNMEEIAAYHFQSGNWQEIDSASVNPGQYENPTAICLKGDEPVVAWTRIRNGNWDIEVTNYENGKPRKTIVLSSPNGKATKPRLVAGKNGKIWLVWENYYKSRFSIYISRFEKGHWTSPQQMTPNEKVCFDPALVETNEGEIYLVYGITRGIHQNIEMRVFNGSTLKLNKVVSVAEGGELADRVNLNTKPALALDKNERLWISWENNRNTTRLEDGDNYTGNRCCSMVCYKDGQLLEPQSGKWLFNGQNDHLPTFVTDLDSNLFVFTRCGGEVKGERNWKFRLSRLNPDKGWSGPETFLATDQQGQSSEPAVIFAENEKFWLAWRFEKFIETEEGIAHKQTKLNLSHFACTEFSRTGENLQLGPTIVKGHLPAENSTSIGGRNRVERRKMHYRGEEYTMILGDLHEHSEGSYCWPAGTDGTLHDDYRYGLYSEGYDFIGFTDHTNHMDEPWFRKNLRIADFYNEDDHFLAIPSVEWTLSSPRGYKTIPYGAGHRNIIFASTKDAEKFIRNEKEIYSERSPECNSAPKLWELIRNKEIECVAIPHHPTCPGHPVCWEAHDKYIEPVVELFQARGNAEYPGCPKENWVSTFKATDRKEAFVDYALRERGYQMGFIGSGEHNDMGIGLAVLWVKEVNRRGIIEALRARRVFATTGDKIFVDIRVNGGFMGEVIKYEGIPEIFIFAQSQGAKPIKKVELLRNSRIIKSWEPAPGDSTFSTEFNDDGYKSENGVLYYYVRITQNDGHLAWSSPVYFDIG